MSDGLFPGVASASRGCLYPLAVMEDVASDPLFSNCSRQRFLAAALMNGSLPFAFQLGGKAVEICLSSHYH